MEGPPSLQTETTTHKQSLASTKPSPLTETSHTEQQNLLEANHHDTADGAEPQANDVQYDGSTHNWGESREDKLRDYNEKVFWEPELGSVDGNAARSLSTTMAKIVKEAFCNSPKPEKRKSITCKCQSPIHHLLKCQAGYNHPIKDVSTSQTN